MRFPPGFEVLRGSRAGGFTLLPQRFRRVGHRRLRSVQVQRMLLGISPELFFVG